MDKEFYFMRKDHEITVKCRWGSGGAIPTAAGSFRSCGGGSAGKDHEKFLHLEGKQKKPRELIYFECKFDTNLFLYALK